MYSDDDSKVKRVTKYYGIKNNNILKYINDINKERRKHYNYYTGRDWNNNNNYDLLINVDKLGVEKTVKQIAQFIENYYIEDK